jgi:Short C-terminal domain
MAIVLRETRTEPDTGAFSDHSTSSLSSKHREAAWRLELLKALHAKSLVTDEEFEAKRGKILATT